MSANQSDAENPYAAPQVAPPSESQEGRCPKCGSSNRKMPGFTWWGGAIGPRLLNHAQCLDCGAGYNLKTGRSNTPAIIAYQVVMLVLALAFIWWLHSM